MFNMKNILKNKLLARETAVVERTLSMVRNEYTVMPRFGFHQPLDYYIETPPVKFETPLRIDGEELLVPAPDDRMGYSPSDAEEYLSWGRDDKNFVKAQIDKHLNKTDSLAILDFGCSSGRVLHHFHAEAKLRNWSLSGVDIQALGYEVLGVESRLNHPILIVDIPEPIYA